MADAGARRFKAYRRGHRSEWLAALALRLKGYRILARRYRTKLGEIDLIARRGDLVLIVEVKARRTLVEAMEAIARESEHRIEGAADMWLSRQKDFARLSVRFDMVAVLPWRWPVHVENAFRGEELTEGGRTAATCSALSAIPVSSAPPLTRPPLRSATLSP